MESAGASSWSLPVVVKVLNSVLVQNREHRGRFEREAAIFEELDHPAFPALIYRSEDDENPYFVLESNVGERSFISWSGESPPCRRSSKGPMQDRVISSPVARAHNGFCPRSTPPALPDGRVPEGIGSASESRRCLYIRTRPISTGGFTHSTRSELASRGEGCGSRI